VRPECPFEPDHRVYQGLFERGPLLFVAVTALVGAPADPARLAAFKRLPVQWPAEGLLYVVFARLELPEDGGVRLLGAAVDVELDLADVLGDRVVELQAAPARAGAEP
jgi:hypothetical protein